MNLAYCTELEEFAVRGIFLICLSNCSKAKKVVKAPNFLNEGIVLLLPYNFNE